jgi:26S proteasome regulatory subunit N2
MKEALALLDPMTRDSVPFVRQGAFIALSMILIQISEKSEPKVKEIRQQLMEIIGDNYKQQSPMAKFGAIIALGIIDAGGRNMTIALSSRSGHMNFSAIVGIAIFVQYWYWYPFLLFLSLALSPTAIIAVNSQLEMPNYIIKSNAKPSLFAYPAEVKEVEEKTVKVVPTAQLSITKKQQQRKDKKKAEAEEKKKTGEGDKMEIEKPVSESQDNNKTGDNMEIEEEKTVTVEDKKKVPEKPESEFELLDNPARVTRSQLKYITFDVDPRYVPITEGVHGVILLKDTKPGETEDIIKGGVPSLTTQDDENEPAPPEPFLFSG